MWWRHQKSNLLFLVVPLPSCFRTCPHIWVEPVAMLRGVEPRSTERQSAIICRYTIASFNLHKAQKKIYTESNRNPCLLDKCSTNELLISSKEILLCAPLVRKVGLEPTRHRWQRLLRPPCLPFHHSRIWCGTRDLNPHESPQQGLNLPPMPFG